MENSVCLLARDWHEWSGVNSYCGSKISATAPLWPWGLASRVCARGSRFNTRGAISCIALQVRSPEGVTSSARARSNGYVWMGAAPFSPTSSFGALVIKAARSIGVEPRALAVLALLHLPRVASHEGWVTRWQVQRGAQDQCRTTAR